MAADKDTGIIRAVETTPANEPDVATAPSIIPEEPGEVYADKAYDALAVEKAIEAKGGTSKLMRKGHRWLPAARLEAHNRPLRPVRARIEKIFGTWKRSWMLLRTSPIRCFSDSIVTDGSEMIRCEGRQDFSMSMID
jgi:IS5 family transposase